MVPKELVRTESPQVRRVLEVVGVDSMVVVAAKAVVVMQAGVVADPATVVPFVLDRQYIHQLVLAMMDSHLYFSLNSLAHSPVDSPVDSRAHNHRVNLLLSQACNLLCSL